MLGCASLEGTDPSRLAMPLAFLHHHAGTTGEWAASALPERYVSMDRMKNTVDFINKNIDVPGEKLTAEQIYAPGYLPEKPITP